MVIDWDIRVGDLLTVAGFVGLGLVLLFRVGRQVELGSRMERDIEELQESVKEVTKVLSEVAVQNTRLDEQARRMNAIEERIENIRQVFVPVNRGVG